VTWEAWTTAAIVIIAMALFASEKLRVDVVALIALFCILSMYFIPQFWPFRDA
jgi:hypothetical protein